MRALIGGRRLAAAVALLVLSAVATVDIGIQPAGATYAPCPAGTGGPYRSTTLAGTTHAYYCSKTVYRADHQEEVLILWGFDYAPSGHLRAFAYLGVQRAATTPPTIAEYARPINLGSRNGVLQSNSGSALGPYPLFVETAAEPSCHKGADSFYIADLTYEIRWSNGGYTTTRTGQLGESGATICQ